MQLLKRFSASALSCILLAACTSLAAKSQDQSSGVGEQPKSAIRLNYHLYNRESVGLVRAFDDGQKTILQFVDLDDTAVSLFDDAGREITGIKRIGLYLVTPALYRSLFVRVSGREAAVVHDTDGSDFVLGTQAKPAASSNSSPSVSQEKVNSAAAAVPMQNAPAQFALSNVVTSPAAPLAVSRLSQWEIKAGDSLRATLESWCERAGYRLVWNVDGGFRSQGGFVSEDEFKKAVRDLFAAIPQDLHLDVDVTKNKLVIVSGGGQ